MAVPADVFGRCINIFSFGPMFSVEDWALGWVVGPADVLKYFVTYAQWMRFCPNVPAQAALALFVGELQQEQEGLEGFLSRQRQNYAELYRQRVAELRSADAGLDFVKTELEVCPMIRLSGGAHSSPLAQDLKGEGKVADVGCGGQTYRTFREFV